MSRSMTSKKTDGKFMDMSPGRKGRCGRPTAVTNPWDMPSINRTSYRNTAVKSGVHVSSLRRLWRPGGGSTNSGSRRCSRMSRRSIGWVLCGVTCTGEGGVGVLVDMYDSVHIDEKWFNVMKDGTRVYLHPAENKPNPPRAQNKQFITKYHVPYCCGTA
ncbi:unnamed protein product [Discosporangium mesarthrocarpum]